MSDTTRHHNALVTATNAELKRSSPNRYGLLKADIDGAMQVRVTEGLRDRAMRILQSVIVQAQVRGWIVRARRRDTSYRGYSPAGVVVGEELVTFVLAEGSRLMSLSERKTLFGDSGHHYKPTGLLRLQITSRFEDKTRLSWPDGHKRKVEDLIEPFLDAVGAAAEESRVRSEAHREVEKDAEECEQLEDRKEKLEEQLTGWRWSASVRKMVAEVKRRSANDPDDVWRSESVLGWIAWAEEEARRADPFDNGYFHRALLDSQEGD